MKKSSDDKAFLKTINDILDQEVEAIDDATKAALRDIRLSALAQSSDNTRQAWQWLSPVPIMAVASMVLVLGVTLQINMTASTEFTPALEDIPLLMAEDDIDFYNDLEFYQWLEVKQDHG